MPNRPATLRISLDTEKSKTMSIYLKDGLSVHIHQLEGPHAPRPLPLENGFRPEIPYQILGIYCFRICGGLFDSPKRSRRDVVHLQSPLPHSGSSGCASRSRRTSAGVRLRFIGRLQDKKVAKIVAQTTASPKPGNGTANLRNVPLIFGRLILKFSVLGIAVFRKVVHSVGP